MTLILVINSSDAKCFNHFTPKSDSKLRKKILNNSKLNRNSKFHLENAEKQISLPEGVARGFILTVRI